MLVGKTPHHEWTCLNGVVAEPDAAGPVSMFIRHVSFSDLNTREKRNLLTFRRCCGSKNPKNRSFQHFLGEMFGRPGRPAVFMRFPKFKAQNLRYMPQMPHARHLATCSTAPFDTQAACSKTRLLVRLVFQPQVGSALPLRSFGRRGLWVPQTACTPSPPPLVSYRFW